MSLMCLGGPYRGLPAAVSGPILSLGIFFATYAYMSWRGTASRAEWLLPFGIGAIPGLLLLRLMNPRKRGA